MFLLFYQFLFDQIQIIPESSTLSLGEYFWQIIATGFGAVLIWMVKRDFAKRDAREEKNTEAINTLKTNVAVLSSDVEKIRDDIDRFLESK